MFSMFRLDRRVGRGIMTSLGTASWWFRIRAEPGAMGHGFRAWASVLGAACRGAFVAVLGSGFAAHVFGIGRLSPVSSR